VVVLDSPWETDYNTFVPNPSRYPEFEQMVRALRTDGVRIVLWVTQMVNEDSFDLEPGGDTYQTPSAQYQIASNRGYFVNDGETYFWWKGRGAAIDFWDEAAMTWWHEQQDPLLELGINGWKLDFGESYITTATIATDGGVFTHQAYSERYYQDFLTYGANKREGGTREFVTMVRPWDESYQFAGRFFARKEHAPVAWVGDNRRDFLGLIDALDHIFRSAKAGYVMVGSDVGGYLTADDKNLLDAIPYDDEAFMRWTSVGALTPFMQLHGRANLEPWAAPGRTEMILAGYRYWSWLHQELVPFFYSLTKEAYAGGPNLVRPIGDGPADWQNDWRYQLGDAFLVAPQLDASGVRDVRLPADAGWYDWWRPEADLIEGGTLLTDYTTTSTRVPFFVREGAIIPAKVSRDLTGLGSMASEGYLSLRIYPAEDLSQFVVHEEDDAETLVRAERMGSVLRVEVDRSRAGLILSVRADSPVTKASLNGRAVPVLSSFSAFEAANAGFYFEAPRRLAWVKLPPQAGLHRVELTR
jgi:alpha-glucosidase (family GH31 glycosyl hydrolase)